MSNIRGYRIVRAGWKTYIPQYSTSGHWMFFENLYSRDGYLELRAVKFFTKQGAAKFLQEMGAEPEQIKEYRER